MRSSRWPVMTLAEVLTHRKQFITINDDAVYMRPRVQLAARGVVQRDRVMGETIKTKQQQVCRHDDFLVAEIDAKAGGYGLVPANLEGAIVSSHYFLFEVQRARLDPAFLGWFARAPDFAAQVTAKGSTNYAAIRPSDVLGYRMPLPPLAEQERVVARLDGAAERITRRAEAAKAAEVELGAVLHAAFRHMTGNAPFIRLGDVAPLIRRAVSVDPNDVYKELGIRSFGRGTFPKSAVAGVEIASKAVFAIEPGDLLFNIIFAWEGAIAVARPIDEGRIGSHRFLTCVPDAARATAEFLRFALLSPEGMAQIRQASPGGAGRNRTLSLSGCANLRIPLPNLDVQQEFDRLHAKAETALAAQREAAAELDKLMPALLHEAFGEERDARPALAA